MDHLIAKASSTGHGLSSGDVGKFIQQPAPSLSTTGDGSSHSVQPVFGALATEHDARFFLPDDVTRQNNLGSPSFATHHISEMSSDDAAATILSSVAKAYRQAEMLTLQHIETTSIIL